MKHDMDSFFVGALAVALLVGVLWFGVVAGYKVGIAECTQIEEERDG